SDDTWGAGIALAADLELRARTDRTLDDYMRALWAEFGRAQRDHAPVKTYTVADARRILGRVAGDTAWANGFFARHVTGTESPDYAALLAPAGILLRQVAPEAAWVGPAGWRAEEDRVVLASPAIVGTPLYEAGMERGDRLVSFDGQPVTTPQQVTERLAAHRPGDRVAITFESRGTTHEAT